MKVATGTVVRARVIADGLSFADGTTVYIVARDDRQPVTLSGEELAELEAGIAEADRGELIPGDGFLDTSRRFGQRCVFSCRSRPERREIFAGRRSGGPPTDRRHVVRSAPT